MQESYAKQLEEKITVGISEKSKLFADRARVCLHLRAENIQNTVDRVEDGVSRVEDGIGRVEDVSNKNTDLFNSINNLLVGIVKDAECNVFPPLANKISSLTECREMYVKAKRASRRHSSRDQYTDLGREIPVAADDVAAGGSAKPGCDRSVHCESRANRGNPNGRPGDDQPRRTVVHQVRPSDEYATATESGVGDAGACIPAMVQNNRLPDPGGREYGGGDGPDVQSKLLVRDAAAEPGESPNRRATDLLLRLARLPGGQSGRRQRHHAEPDRADPQPTMELRLFIHQLGLPRSSAQLRNRPPLPFAA